MNRVVGAITCTPLAGVEEGRGAPSFSHPPYVRLFSAGFEHNARTHTWQFSSRVQNLLRQAIGTTNGTSTSGVRTMLSDLRVSAGKGAVVVGEHGEVDDSSFPPSSTIEYHESVPASAYTGWQTWTLNVADTVTAISFRIDISAHFPAELSMTNTPPDTVATWVEADTNVGGRSGPSVISIPYAKRVLDVRFRNWATLGDRQIALAAVNGEVVGSWGSKDGVIRIYVVRIPDDGTGSGVMAARSALKRLPQVEAALIRVYMTGS